MQCMEVWGGNQLTSQTVEFGGLETLVYSQPYGGAPHGGDVYYASSCATGRITRLLLADVAGHGSAVAATAAGLRTLMRRFVNCLDQTEFVKQLNRHFSSLPRQGAFATAIVATFFAPTRRLAVCNAGHPRPLLFRAASQQWSLLSPENEVRPSLPCNLPLGLLTLSDYDQFEVELQPGDRVLAYTDALMESNHPDGEMLGEEGVLHIVRRLPNPSPASLLAAIAALHPENLTSDDVTVLLFTATGRPPANTWSDRFRALARLFTTALSGGPLALPDWNLANLGGALFPALAQSAKVSPTPKP